MTIRSSRGRGTLPALATLAVRSGLTRHPLAAARVLARLGGSLPAAIEIGALRSPRGLALADTGRTISHAALRDAVRASTTGLAARFPARTRIAVASDGRIDTIVLLASAVAAGLVVVPLGPRLGFAEESEVTERERTEVVLPASAAPDLAVTRGVPPRRRPGWILFLSGGATGAPHSTSRGALSLRALGTIADLERRIRWPRGPILVAAPPDHGHGLSAAVAGLVRGDAVLLASAMPTSDVADLVAMHRPTAVTGVPAQLLRLVDAGALDAGTVTRVVSGSSSLSDDAARRISERTGASVIDCLGATETGTFAVRDPIAGGGFRPLARVELTVTDGSGAAVADRVTGLLRVRTPLARGAVVTGDRAMRMRRGLVLCGRADGRADSGGELIAAERTRRALLSLPGVASCRVHERADDLRGTVLEAEVEVSALAVASSVTPAALRAGVRPLVGAAGVPREIIVCQKTGEPDDTP